MDELITYIMNKYLDVIQDRIDFAVSILEGDNYEGKESFVRKIVESIRDNNLANIEREIENDYPVFQRLEQYLPKYVDLKDIEKDFKIIYDSIGLSIADFLDNDMEKDNIMSLKQLNELSKKIDNYKNSLVALRDMNLDGYHDIEEESNNINIEKVESSDLEKTVDDIDNNYEALMESQVEEDYEDSNREEYSMNNLEQEYDHDAFLKAVSESQEFFKGIDEESYSNTSQNYQESNYDQQMKVLKDSSKNIENYMNEFKEKSQKNTDEFIEATNRIYNNSDNRSSIPSLDDYDLTPIDVKIDELVYGDKKANIDGEDYLHLNDPAYTNYIDVLTGKFDELLRRSDKETKKLNRNKKILNKRELDYEHLKRVNDDRRERRVKIPIGDYINEGILYTVITSLRKKIQKSEIIVSELEHEKAIVKQQLFSPTTDVQDVLRNNRLTGVGNRRNFEKRTTLVRNDREVQIKGTTQDFIEYSEEETKKRIY